MVAWLFDNIFLGAGCKISLSMVNLLRGTTPRWGEGKNPKLARNIFFFFESQHQWTKKFEFLFSIFVWFQRQISHFYFWQLIHNCISNQLPDFLLFFPVFFSFTTNIQQSTVSSQPIHSYTIWYSNYRRLSSRYTWFLL